MTTIISYQEAIEQLVLQGYTILEIIPQGGEQPLFFVVYHWQEGYFNTAQSIDFNTVEGINVTGFLSKSGQMYRNVVEFTTAFNDTLNKGTVVRCEFSKTTSWYKWSPCLPSEQYRRTTSAKQSL